MSIYCSLEYYITQEIVTVNRHVNAESKEKFLWRPIRYDATQNVLRLTVDRILCDVKMCGAVDGFCRTASYVGMSR
jgi:hypothetical protein